MNSPLAVWCGKCWRNLGSCAAAVSAALLVLPSLVAAQPLTFSTSAPQAKQVYFAGEMTDWDKGKLPMRRDADGTWKIDVDLGPGQWLYKFVVDGKWVYDSHAQHDADGFGDQHSFLFVGDGPWLERQGIPHGEVKSLMLPSDAWGKSMKLNLYFPPGYEAGKPYPVLLLLHGLGMDADQWLKTGVINRYMDNLLAQGKIQPFVIVMPSSERLFYNGVSEKFITTELPTWLKAQYGLVPGPTSFAVAGMSMGGFGAFYLPLTHPQQFGFGFSLSAAFYPTDFMATLKQHHALPFKTMLVSGSDDAVTPTDRQVVAELQSWNAPFYYREDPGAHTWNFWSLHTAEMLQAVSAYFTTGTAPNNADSAHVVTQDTEGALPIEGQEISVLTVPISRVLGKWRGQWQVEGAGVQGRFEETITAINGNRTEGTYSVFDAGQDDKTDIPFSVTSRIANGRVYCTDAKSRTDEVVYSLSNGQLWRQWRSNINGSNIFFKVRKVEAADAQ